MIPKRSTRGQREPSKAAPPPLPAGKGPRPGNYDLIESIVGLQVRQAPLEMLAEHALPLLLKAFGAAAGALLVHHRDDGTLRLIASSALAEAGRKALECLRPGAGGGWEIPLHGLLNRKAYIIERPHEHPFVPQLVERGSGGGPPNLASIPLYRGQLPVGVLLVIAERAPLTEAEIVSHVLVYDVLSLALEAGLRARGQAAAAAAPADGGAEEQGLRCEEWVDSAAVARQLEVQVAGMTRERDALASRLGEIEARYGEVVRALESQVAEHTRILETERAESTRRLAERAREAEGQHAGERADLAQRLAALEQRLAEERAVAEATRARLESELAENAAALEARVQTLEATLREREDALVAVRTECDRLRQAAVTQDDVVGRLSEEMEARGARVEEADATHRRELEHARAGFEQELGELRAAHAQELGELRATAQRELLELRESSEHKLAQLRAGRDRERSETRATHEHELAELRATHESMLAQLETAGAEACARAAAAERREADLAGELLAMREEVGRLGGERERVRAALGGDGVEPVAAIESLHARVVALAAEVRGLAEERDEIARCAVEADEASTTRFASEQRAREEQRAGHERALGELRAAHRHELEELYALHRRELDNGLRVLLVPDPAQVPVCETCRLPASLPTFRP